MASISSIIALRTGGKAGACATGALALADKAFAALVKAGEPVFVKLADPDDDEIKTPWETAIDVRRHSQNAGPLPVERVAAYIRVTATPRPLAPNQAFWLLSHRHFGPRVVECTEDGTPVYTGTDRTWGVS